MILQQLSEAIGISGKEDAIRKIILEAIDGHVEDIRIDPMGSITALKRGTGEDLPRVMIAGHMDEVGFMVTDFGSDGLIQFAKVGGFDDRILPGLRVKLGEKLIPGVILWKPIHMGREQKVVEIDDLRIDIGASSKKEAQNKLKIGDRIAFDSQFMELGETILRGKAFDDRVGCSLLIDILQGGPYPVDILAAFTVQEEVGLRGARVAAQILKPDVAIALEGTTANDIPDPMIDFDDEDVVNPACRIGDGPVLTVMDRSIVVNPRLLDFLRTTAENNDIPYQYKTVAAGGTDAGAIHKSGAGVPSAVISTPCRYIHAPVSYLSKDDYANVLKLVKSILNDITFDAFQYA
jgi:tetrahedral aminopeptidase